MHAPTARVSRIVAAVTLSLAGLTAGLAGCTGDIGDSGSSIEQVHEGLTGCRGQAASSIPADGRYYLTTFGFSPADDGLMSCGTRTNHGNWYYAASRQRYGCGSKIRISNPSNGRCVVAQTDDYGPDVCVERAAGKPIIDASPLVGVHLFGGRSAGWSDRFLVEVAEVADGTPLGPCGADPTGGTGGGTQGGAASDDTCTSATLGGRVAEGTCVQSSSDASWYHCVDASWQSGRTGCSQSFAWCDSATLGRSVPPRTCVQARSDRAWYQCGQSGWEPGVSNGAGPLGDCASLHAL